MLSRRVAGLDAPWIDQLKSRADTLAAGGADVISLGQAVPGFPPPASALRAARAALDSPAVHVYTADAGTIELRTAVAAWLGDVGGGAAGPENLLITAGANQVNSLRFEVDQPELLKSEARKMAIDDALEALGDFYLRHGKVDRAVDAALKIGASRYSQRLFIDLVKQLVHLGRSQEAIEALPGQVEDRFVRRARAVVDQDPIGPHLPRAGDARPEAAGRSGTASGPH